jgi:hypothetical protein
MKTVRDNTLTMLRFRLLSPPFRTGAEHITGKRKATSLKDLRDAVIRGRCETAFAEPESFARIRCACDSWDRGWQKRLGVASGRRASCRRTRKGPGQHGWFRFLRVAQQRAPHVRY